MIPRKEMGEHLGRGGSLAGDRCCNSGGLIILLQTVRAISPDILAGHRRTDIETILD